MTELSLIALGVTMFTFIILALALLILYAKSRLVPGGTATITINEAPDHTVYVSMGNKLMNELINNKIFIPSACGGGGTCGQCKLIVKKGGGEILPVEKSKLSRGQLRDHFRLSCQLSVKNDMELQIPEEILETRKRVCSVLTNRNVASFIKELVLALPKGERLDFRAGGYVLIDAPPHVVHYKDFVIDETYRDDWDKFDLWRYSSIVNETVSRAYSMANYPDENDIVMLNVRIALPPAYKPDAPPGMVSSYIFSLKPGDEVTISGPYGEFLARETGNEMFFIGGGAGMAPLRSHIFDQLKRIKTTRRISFWYGARNLREALYVDDFNRLQEEHGNFHWHMALSRPRPEDNWKKYRGYVHNCLHDMYLKDHPSPEDCEYYLCGPPPLVASVVHMLDSAGVEPENIMYDDFGE